MADLKVGPVDDGVNTGDFLRWNAITSKWEKVVEPLELTEIKLIPKASSTGPEGTIFFCSGDKYLYVGVDT